MALNIPWSLFGKLLRGDIRQSEQEEIINWRDLSELNRNIYNEILEDEGIKKILLSGKWEDNTLEWEKLLTRIKPSKNKITITYRKLYLAGASAAAVFIFIFISSVLLVKKVNQKDLQSQQGYTTIFSPRGQRTKVILPDQTNVWLNSESSLRYPVTYNQNIREVYLEGEGFFEVSKNPQKPFYVQTNDLKVKVYGTSFNLKAFPNEKNIEATLIEGKLSVTPFDQSGSAGKEIFLKPKEKLIYKKFTNNQSVNTSEPSKKNPDKRDTLVISQEKKKKEVNIILEKNINTNKDMLWKDGKLIFNNETFEELAVKLERWYDIKIHFEDEKIKNYKFTGEFSKETADQAMEALKISSQHSYDYKMVFRDIYLSRRTN
jgi:transmembrane sensor